MNKTLFIQGFSRLSIFFNLHSTMLTGSVFQTIKEEGDFPLG
jgi:hypothetical protein